MKLTKYAAMAAAVALMASCSDNGADTPTPDKNGSPISYAAFNIVLPSMSSSRADEGLQNETTAGTPAEYAVKNGTVYIFQGTTEGTAKFVTSSALDLAFQTGSDGYVTTTGKAIAVFKSEDVSNPGNYYLAVILNHKSTVPSLNPNDTFDKFQDEAKALDYIQNDDNYFTMTTAPSYSDGTVTYLSQMNDKFYNEIVPDMEPAATVYVQRVAAKVGVVAKEGENLDAFKVTADETTGSKQGDLVDLSIWALDILNTKSYIFQNISADDWKNVEKPALYYSSNSYSGHTRIHWAKDLNYGSEGTHPETAAPNIQFPTTAATVAYCHENTFDVDNQKKDRTTRVVIKATYKPVKGNITTGDGDQEIGTNYTGDFVKMGKSLYTMNGLKKALEAELTTAGIEDNYVITLKENPTSGNYKFIDETDGFVTITGTNAEAAISHLKAKYNLFGEKAFVFYKGGECYYQIRIRHFADTELYESGTYTYPESGYDAKKDQGRYGVVRNNWYELTMNSVKGIGEPTEPGTPDDEDDDEDPEPESKYISVEINILAWAKRSQGVDL